MEGSQELSASINLHISLFEFILHLPSDQHWTRNRQNSTNLTQICTGRGTQAFPSGRERAEQVVVGKPLPLHVLFLSISWAARSGTMGWSQHVPHTPGDCKNSQHQPTSACLVVVPPTHTSIAAEWGQSPNTCEHVAPSHRPEAPLAALFSFLPPAELSCALWCSCK